MIICNHVHNQYYHAETRLITHTHILAHANEKLRDIRDDPEVLDPPKHIALALACTRTDVYTIYST